MARTGPGPIGPRGEARARPPAGPDDEFARAEERAVVDGLLAHLSPREQDVLRMRFERDMTQAEIAARIGVSQMQISRVIRQAIERMREVAEQGSLS